MRSWTLLLFALLVERELDLLPVVIALLGDGELEPWRRTLLLQFDAPRLVLGLLVGSGMAISGWVLQKATRNPMAGPAVVSIQSAAAFGVILFLWLGGGSMADSRTLPWIAAGSGTLSALLLVSLVGARRALDGSGLLLAGIALGALWTAGTFLVALNAPPATHEYAVAWMYGSLDRATWDYVLLLFPAWWFLSLAVLHLAHRAHLLSLDDPLVTSLGGRPDAWRRGALCLAAALGAACVGVGGSFTFLGFLAPSLVRRLQGRSFHTPHSSALAGALLLLAADVLGQSLVPPAEVPAGIVVAVLGAPLFLIGLTAWGRAWRLA